MSTLKSVDAVDRLSTPDERQEMYNEVMWKLTGVQQDCQVSE